MKDTAPLSLGIVAVAALFGIIALGVALVLFDLGWMGSCFVGVVIAIITAIVLTLGWREPANGPQGVSSPAPTPAATAPTPAPAPTPTPAPAPAPAPAVAKEVVEEPAPAEKPAPVEEPVAAEKPAETTDGKPTFLSAAREGGPDDLKQIKGVGPKLEKTLHGMGIFHFDQISTWGPAEQAWMDDNLAGFKGRATRDNWVEQAKTLAAGGTTEFSSKVKKGNVY